MSDMRLLVPGGRPLSPPSPVEVDSFLCELPLAVQRVLVGLVLDDLHAFASIALLMAVFADHVQLPDTILEDKHTTGFSQRGKKMFCASY